ncbi:MAG: hypothetical protein ABI624_12400 [Casimicrobiaceae bacterium]
MRRANLAVLCCALSLAGADAVAADTVPRGPAPTTAGEPSRPSLSKATASTIAHRFFASEIGMEGSVGEPVERGDDWAFPLRFGYAGAVVKDPLLVNRFTGAVSWAGLAEHNARLGRTKR